MTESVVPLRAVSLRDNGEQARGLLRVTKYGRLALIHRGTLDESLIDERIKNLVALNHPNDYQSGYIGYEGGDCPDSDIDDSKSGSGKRERVYGLSKSAIRRFLRFSMSLDLRQAAIAIGLTYPDDFPEDQKQWHKHLNALKKRLLRRFSQMRRNAQGKRQYTSEFSAFWRIEFTVRQSGEVKEGQAAPHVHIVLFLKNQEPAKLSEEWQTEFRAWLKKSWYEIVGSKNKDHLNVGAWMKILDLKEQEDVEYFLRYIAKPDYEDKPPDFDIAEYYPMGTGRVWGIWCKENLPMSPIVEIPITKEQFDLIQRYFKEL
jgi:hypothetical protein